MVIYHVKNKTIKDIGRLQTPKMGSIFVKLCSYPISSPQVAVTGVISNCEAFNGTSFTGWYC